MERHKVAEPEKLLQALNQAVENDPSGSDA